MVEAVLTPQISNEKLYGSGFHERAVLWFRVVKIILEQVYTGVHYLEFRARVLLQVGKLP